MFSYSSRLNWTRQWLKPSLTWIELTHYGLVTPYGVMNHGLRPTKNKSRNIHQISRHWSYGIGFPSHKANLMTFCVKCDDIILMTLDWGVNSLRKAHFWWRCKKVITIYAEHMCFMVKINITIKYFIQVWSACLKINMQRSKDRDVEVETPRFTTVTSQCATLSFPTVPTCVNTP